MHIPVLLHETIDLLAPAPGAFVIDGTVDGGGHAEEVLRKIGSEGRMLGIDLDPKLLEQCRARIGHMRNVVLRQGNYADAAAIMREAGLPKADGLLLDLGFSSEQLEEEGKGLSFIRDEPLVLTYDPAAEPFRETLQSLSEEEIAEILTMLGEERYAKRIAAAIYARERKNPLRTTKELADLVISTVPANYERGRLHPATRTFQAFRIYANDELGNLHRILETLPEILVPGGRVAIISFHSLEDRIVKNAFRDGAHAGTLELLNKKPITAQEEELRSNPRARSAKLRAAKLVSSL